MDMIADRNILITRAETSRLNELNFDKIPFGRYFTDHMLEADYEKGEWVNVEIKPYQPLVLSPSLSAIHYGQSIFEGIKAYKNKDGKVNIFRPVDNWKRFNQSAKRLCMPEVPYDIFIEGMQKLIQLDEAWVSDKDGHSLYIRPFMFSTEEFIGVAPAERFKFMIILSPAGLYYSAPVKIYVEEKYTRAAPGGVGFVKAAGNYALSMLPTREARQKGFDQVLWTDSVEHKYAQEIGTMNVFFVLNGKVVTPDLSSGTILAGVTRDSAIRVLRDLGYIVEERPVSLEELVEAHQKGEFTQAFGTGTAATISEIALLSYRGTDMPLQTGEGTVAVKMKKDLDDIRYGRVEDRYNWLLSC
jgi:branched-chain amino acid aminotransferase